jgi:hypothetical protein
MEPLLNFNILDFAAAHQRNATSRRTPNTHATALSGPAERHDSKAAARRLSASQLCSGTVRNTTVTRLKVSAVVSSGKKR